MSYNRKKAPIRDLKTYGRTRSARLGEIDYSAAIDVHCTNCADNGKPFADDSTASMVCDNVEFYCNRLGFVLYGYCLMPDHHHILFSPGTSGVAVSTLVQRFKSYTTHCFMESGREPPLWQRAWHDHVCRNGETAESVLAYVVNNPVRAGFVRDWQDWKWTKVLMKH